MSLARPPQSVSSKAAPSDAPPAPAKPAPSEPAPAPSPPKSAPIEPLDAHEPGRSEARASFVADTAAPEEKSTAPVIERAADGKAEAVTMTAEQLAELTTKLFSGLVGAAGPKFIGGERATWIVTEPEQAALKAASVPVIEKYGAAQMSPEALLIGVALSIILPRALASMNAPA